MYFNWSKSSLRYPHPNPITSVIHQFNLPSNTPQRWTKKCSINANAGRFSISANLWRVLSWQIMFFIATFARKTLFRLGIKWKPRGGWKRQSHLNISGNINFNKKPFIAPHKRKHKRILKGFQEGAGFDAHKHNFMAYQRFSAFLPSARPLAPPHCCLFMMFWPEFLAYLKDTRQAASTACKLPAQNT